MAVKTADQPVITLHLEESITVIVEFWPPFLWLFHAPWGGPIVMIKVMPISFGIDVAARSYPERTMNRTCTKCIVPSFHCAMTWNERK